MGNLVSNYNAAHRDKLFALKQRADTNQRLTLFLFCIDALIQ